MAIYELVCHFKAFPSMGIGWSDIHGQFGILIVFTFSVILKLSHD